MKAAWTGSAILVAFWCLSVASSASELSLVVAGRSIELSPAEWTKLSDEADYAKNYEQKKRFPWQEYARVITVFMIPMSVDRRIGLKISDHEYVEFFITHPGLVTAQTRVDKGQYWVLCRETFHPKEHSSVDVSAYKPFLSESENQRLWQLYQAEIDETRYLIGTKL